MQLVDAKLKIFYDFMCLIPAFLFEKLLVRLIMQGEWIFS